MVALKVTDNNKRIQFYNGFISTEIWGDLNNEKHIKIIAVHGWADNAGTFDRLFSLFPSDRYCIISVDLPGHGQSDHLPSGAVYSEYVWVSSLKAVIDFFSLTENVHFIAHSMGSNAVLLLASLYPNLVGSFVMLDNVMPRICPAEKMAKLLAQDIERFNGIVEQMTNNPSLKSRVYDYETAIQVIILSHSNGKIDRIGSECLLRRAIKHCGANKVMFLRDPRLNSPIYQRKTKSELIQTMSEIQAQRLLILRARNTALSTDDDCDFVELYKSSFKEVHYCQVPGDHYAHLSHARDCLPHILEFLSQIAL